MRQSLAETRVGWRDEKMINGLADLASPLCIMTSNPNGLGLWRIKTKNHTTANRKSVADDK